MTIDIGTTGIWCGFWDAHPTSEVQEAVAELEELGYSAVWVPETVGRDPFVVASTMLAATSSLAVATGIANIYARDPLTMVACQRTLAEAYDNRFLLGLGVSHEHLVAKLRKHDFSKPVAYMEHYLAAMDEARYLALGPTEDPGRVLAALGPRMLGIARDHAAGAHPYLTTPEHTAGAREALGPDRLLAPEQMCVLETDPTEARRIARQWLSVYLRAPNYLNNLKRLGFDESDWPDHTTPSDHLVDSLVAWGTPEDVKARVDEHRAAGADHVCVQVLESEMVMPRDGWRRLAEVLLD